MQEFTAPSGAKIIINPADWKYAKALKKAIEKEIDPEAGINLENPETMLRNLLNIDSSDAVDNALWPCLIVCTRESQKITEDTFNNPEARKDYYDIIMACIKENLSPLVGSLFSKFSALMMTQPKQAEEAPKSE